MRAVALLLMCAGCDWVFRIDRVTDKPDAADVLATCPTSYAHLIGLPYRYRSSSANADWKTAEDSCRNDSVGAITHLPVFGSVAELAVFADHFFALPSPPPYLHAGYARDLAADVRAFRAVTDGPILPELWGQSEPNNLSGADTVTGVEIDSRRIDDLPPTRSYPYVCVCDGVSATAMFSLSARQAGHLQ